MASRPVPTPSSRIGAPGAAFTTRIGGSSRGVASKLGETCDRALFVTEAGVPVVVDVGEALAVGRGSVAVHGPSLPHASVPGAASTKKWGIAHDPDAPSSSPPAPQPGRSRRAATQGWATPGSIAVQPRTAPSESVRSGDGGAVETGAGAAAAVAWRADRGGDRLGPVRPSVPVPVPLRPMTLADILDGAVEILKLAPRTVIVLTAVLVLPIQMATLVVANTGLENPSIIGVLGSPLFAGQVGSDRSNVGIVLFVLSSAVLPVLTGAIAWMVASWYGGTSPGLAEVGRAVGRKVPVLLLVWLIVHVLELVAAALTFFVLGLGGLAVMVVFLLSAPIVAVEDAGPLGALRRSARLARRGFFRLLMIAVLSAVVENLVFFAFTALSAFTADYSWGWIVSTVLVSIGTIVAKPIVAGATALAYIDLRVRAEGLDIELAMARG